MTKEKLVAFLKVLPEARKLGDEQFWNDTAPPIADQVVSDIISSYDFPFVFRNYTLPTEANVGEYKIEGESKDIRDIVSIRLGSGYSVLPELRPLDAYDAISETQTGSGINFWYEDRRETDNFPIIILVNTPSSVQNLYIRYRIKDITLAQFPDEWSHVIAAGVIGWVTGNDGFYRTKLKQMVKRYKSRGKTTQTMSGDPHMVATNNRIASLYSGGSREDS